MADPRQAARLADARNASSTASGCSAMIACPQSASVTTRAPGIALISACAFFGGAMMSFAPRITSDGQRTLAALSTPVACE
jgi:hypothetical protein